MKQFLSLQRFAFADEKKISAKDLGIDDDLEVIQSSVDKDVKKRALKFEHSPFSAVNIMNSFNHLTSYEELSKAG